MNIEILYENDEVIAINKPPGLIVHADGRTQEPTVVDWIEKNYPELSGVGEEIVLKDGSAIKRPGIVHRLDRETSGALLIAKTEGSFRNLKTQFKERTIKKTYATFVYGEVGEKEGVIDRSIGRSASDFRKWSAQRGARGVLRKATTRYTSVFSSPEVSFLEVSPETGRTHQIRVHLKALHHPVVCDSLYAPKHPCILGFERLALHARCIEFDDIRGNHHIIEASYPADFIDALRAVGLDA